MKILAIRGENIASLADSFEVEFNQSPLKEHGLIAITGKTGAGKSSLLDCMFLALYEQVPRFIQSQRSVEIGAEYETERLKGNDVRHLVSRGKAFGLAEVTFEGHDGHIYTARWQARRARNKSDGRWQASQRELIKHDTSQAFSASKREFQSEIDSFVGLDYEQFRRSVVLAQGDFAAFLKAGEDQRSALLERMTGTELYTRISQQVYENAKLEQYTLDQLDSQLANVSLLDVEQRAVFQEQQQQLKLRDKALEQAQQTQFQQNQWSEQRNNAHSLLSQQQIEYETYLSQQSSMDQLANRLMAIESVEPLREPWIKLSHLRSEIQELDAGGAALTEQLDSAQALQQQNLQILADAKQRQGAHRQLEMDNRDELELARELDHQLTTQRHQITQLTEQFNGADDQQKRAKVKESVIAQQLRVLSSREQETQSWLMDNRHRRLWIDQGPQLQNQFAQMDAQQQHVEAFTLRLQGSINDQQKLQLYLGSVEQEWQTLSHQQNELKERFAAIDVRDEQGLAERYSLLMTEHERSSYQMAQMKDLHGILTNYETYLFQTQTLDTQLADIKAQQTHFITLREQEWAMTQEAQQSYKEAQVLMEISDYRQYLRKEEPCPLCGSAEHPLLDTVIHQEDFANALVAQLAERLEKHQQQLLYIDAEFRASEQLQKHHIASHNERLMLLEQCQKQLASQLDHLADQSWPCFETTDQVHGYIQNLRESYQRCLDELEQLRMQWQQAQQAQKQREQLTQAIHQGDQKIRDLTADIQLTRQKLQQYQEEATQIQQQLEQAQVTLSQLSEQLTNQLGHFDWKVLFAERGAVACLESLSQQAQEFQRIEVESNELNLSQHQLERERETQAVQFSHIHSECEGLHHQLVQAQDSFESQLKQRQQCLQGETTDTWLSRWRQQMDNIEQDSQLAQQHLLVAEQALSAQLAHQSSHQKRSLELSERYESIGQVWQQHVAISPQPESEIETLLAIDLSARQAWQHKLNVYQRKLEQLTQANAASEAQIQRLDHYMTSGQQLFLEQLASLNVEDNRELERERTQCQENYYQLRQMLEQDANAQAESTELSLKRCQQRAQCDTWQGMNQLIGSASGAKFRTFAQQLTLDRLLKEANHQLLALAPRYVLERVPASALALQVVDRDMGDEVRSLSSLSGGETFLVSLGLALALSEMSSLHLDIQSLFIDEGFGSLDPDSLDTVLACLDNLQASGRQITVISHVQTMVERISAQIALRNTGAGRSKLEVVA